MALVFFFAGADFIKTSTGKEGVNATIPVSLVMARAIRDYYERTQYKVRRMCFLNINFVEIRS